jgi:ATP/maltotriose-dependent transcriptional regulator MalT
MPSLILAGLEIAATGSDASRARELAAELELQVRGPRARYARALVEAASGRSPDPGAVEAAAREVEDSGWRGEAARMRLVASQALARSPAAREEAIACARAALESFRRLESEGCCRAAEGVLRALGVRPASPRSAAGEHGLTPRELEVLSLLCEGLSNRRIAERLVISESTAVRHVANVYGKLRVHTRAQAVRVAAELGLLSGGPTA